MWTGVDYYPEHWEPELWNQDIQLMRESGVDIVRIGEFAWSRLEPEEGIFRFDWLDDILNCLARAGIRVVLGTPTNCPPRWLFEAHPDIGVMMPDGDYEKPEIRGHRCYRSPVFRKYAERIVNKLVSRYRDVGIVAWQIDNEVDTRPCSCAFCQSTFREWLERKYGSLETLNKLWHTDVWSGTYSNWMQISIPADRQSFCQHNPGLTLDYLRFAAETTNEYVDFQRKLILNVIPNAKITTNTWFCDYMPDYHTLFRNLDFVSYDNYPPVRTDQVTSGSHAFHLDFMRGILHKPFWIMEQLSGSMGCWMPMGHTPQPGQIAGYGFQAMAHGAEAVIQFRWRSAVGGAEMFWQGLIDHSNVPGRRLKEFSEMARLCHAYENVFSLPIRSDVAVIYSDEAARAFRTQIQPAGFDYISVLKAWHRAFTALGLNVEITDQRDDPEGCRVIVIPCAYIEDPELAERMKRFAENGGTVILTCRSGLKDTNNACVMKPLPGIWAELTQCTVQEYDPLDGENGMFTMNGKGYSCATWCDLIRMEGAEAIATYGDNWYAGTAAVTRARFGKGYVYYIGTMGEDVFCRDLAEMACRDAGLPVLENLPEGVEIVTRESGEKRYLLIFNNHAAKTCLQLPEGKIELKPYEFRVHECAQ